MKTRKITAALLFFVLFALLVPVSSSFGDEIKDRMKERLTAINDLKAAGVIGENNMGYLEFRQTSAANEGLLTAENADRKTVYASIAQKQGATTDFVGKRRAMQIAEKADPGTWLQDETGKWYQK